MTMMTAGDDDVSCFDTVCISAGHEYDGDERRRWFVLEHFVPVVPMALAVPVIFVSSQVMPAEADVTFSPMMPR
ncbi:hypothetical protein Hdeb2414_s0004g00145971 [Helianthus debilis subsp. tardiflorus]